MPVGQQFLQSNLLRTLSAFTASVTHLVCWPFVQRSLMQQQHIQVTLAIANHPQNVGRLISSSTTNRNMKGCKSVQHSLWHAQVLRECRIYLWQETSPRKQLKMVQYGIQTSVPSLYRWKKVGYSVGHRLTLWHRHWRTASATGSAEDIPWCTVFLRKIPDFALNQS